MKSMLKFCAFVLTLLVSGIVVAQPHWNESNSKIALKASGYWGKDSLVIPGDTISKTVGSIAHINDTLYIRNITRWVKASSSGTSGGSSGIGAVYAGLYLTKVNDSTLKADSSALAAYFVRRKDSVAGGYYPYSTNPKSYLTTISGIAAGGDLAGTFPNPTVTWANGYPTYDNRYQTSTSKNQLISGGKVVWLHDYVYNVSAATYLIDGVNYSSASTDITLSTADPTDDRIDLFVLTTSGTAIAVTGTPSTPPVAPDFDANTQLQISFATVAAASSAPTLTQEWVYQENTEWTTSASAGTINPASTSNPYAGSKDVEGTSVANGTYISFTSVSTLTVANYENLIFQIRSKANWGTAKKWIIRFYNGTTAIGNTVTFGSSSYSFVSSATSQYQTITIPLADFGSISTATAFRITQSNTSGTVGWYLDNVQLQGNTGGGAPTTITLVGDVSGAGTNNINVTVTGIKNKVVPALSAGFFKYSGSALIWDGTSYVPTSTTVAGFSLGSNVTLATHTPGYGISGSSYNGSTARTWLADTFALQTRDRGNKIADSLVALVVPINKGGTNITSYTTGDILYASATNVLSKLPAGTTRQKLGIVAGVPAWVDSTASASGITSLNGETGATQTFAIGTTGADPNFTHASNVHTLHIPLMAGSAVNSGLLSNTTQVIPGAKEFSNSSFKLSALAAGSSADKLLVWNTSTGAVGQIAAGSYSGFILDQYTTQGQRAFLDSLKAKERIISDQYYVGSTRYSTITPAMLFDSTQSKRGLYMMGDDKQAGTYNRYMRMYWDATDTSLFRMDITTSVAATPKSFKIRDGGTSSSGNITLDFGTVTLGRVGGGQTLINGALNAQQDITVTGAIYYASGASAPSIQQLRGSSNIAGKDLTITAGPSQTGAATTLAGGNLVLSSGISEGTSGSEIQLFTASTGSSGVDNTPDVKMKIKPSGEIALKGTNTAGGTTGAQTINKATGTVNFAASATSLVVTNSLVTTSSIVFVVIRTNDATAEILNVVPASGSFTINLKAAATAETSVGFMVINNF